MKILVTGGAGYIGTTLVPLLLERGYEVTVLDSLLFGGTALMPFFRNPKFHFVRGDVRDFETLRKAADGKSVIVHLAAIVGFPACRESPDLAMTTNVDGTRNVASVLRAGQYVLFGSTGSNYGDLKDEISTEESSLRPLTIYGKTKTEGEQILLKTNQATAFRFATAFGVSPRMRLDLLINDLTYNAVRKKYIVLYEPQFMRTFIHVHDIARSFLFAIDRQRNMQGEVYNVGHEKMTYSKQEICDIIVRKTGAYAHYAAVGEDADKRNYRVCYRKISELGYRTTISVEEGIDELIRALEALKIPNPYGNV